MNLSRPAGVLAFVFLSFTAAAAAADSAPLKAVLDDDIAFATAQYRYMLAQLDGKNACPRSWENGKLTLATTTNWTCGFFPGSLWYLFEATRDPQWEKAARQYTALVEGAKDIRRTHDVGFMLYCSAGNGYRLTQDPHYRDVLLTGAKSLSTRYSPVVRAIRSWDNRKWPFPVIIDNMMNLELLAWAGKQEPSSPFRQIAEDHADTTLRNHFRPDGSTYHVVSYDPADGKVLARVTHQGYADDSSWARGQSWALYGYTMMYRELRKPAYLEQARRTARFIVHHPRLPADKVPYWDFDAPDIPKAPRDASSAALISSALLELATFVQGAEAEEYRAVAITQLRSLSSPAYRAEVGGNGGFLLLHSTANYPQRSEVDVPLPYADYYFLEAILRARATMRP